MEWGRSIAPATRLDRDVAIKILPDAFAHDADRLARFISGVSYGWSVAAPGLVALRTGASSRRQLTWVDRSGTAQGTVGDPDDTSLTGPRVSPDGRRVVVARTEGAMMAASIAVVGNALEPGAPVVLFPTRIVGGGVEVQTGRQYDVAPDGRFLINMELPGDAAPITLIRHWNPEAKK